MCLGRIIIITDGEARSMITRRWLTKLFVIGDVLSFIMQGAGMRTSPGLHPRQANAVQAVASWLVGQHLL